MENLVAYSGGAIKIGLGSGSHIQVQEGGLFEALNNGSGTTDVTIKAGGSAFIGPDAVVTVFYAENGAKIDMYGGRIFQATLASGASVYEIANMGDNDQTFTYIYAHRNGEKYAVVENGNSLTDAIFAGQVRINSGGAVNGGGAATGGNWIVNEGGTVENLVAYSGGRIMVNNQGTAENIIVSSGGRIEINSMGTARLFAVQDGGSATVNGGGRIEQSFNIEGNLTINCGGVARIWSASTVTGESASLRNEGTVEFLVASAAASGEALLNDYTKINDRYGGYAITVNGDQSSGQYRLIGNAAGFNRNITIRAENSEATGTFQWNGRGYNTVYLDDRAYTLNIDENNDLVLGVGMNPTRVDYQFAEIGQTVYYNGTAPEGSTLEGVLMAIPYTADITVSFDKDLAEGMYEFTTKVEQIEGSVNHFKIQVMDGIPGSDGEPAPKSVSYVSDNMCYFGTLVGETDSTVTYRFSGVEDYVLTDSLQKTMTMEAGADKTAGEAGVDASVINMRSTTPINFDLGNRPDVNKTGWWKTLRVNGINENGADIGLTVTHTDYNYSAWITVGNRIDSATNCVVTRNYNEDKNNYTIIALFRDVNFFSSDPTYYTAVVQIDQQNRTKQMTFKGNDLTDVTAIPELGIVGKEIFAEEDELHCWIATAVNMMTEGGYLDSSIDPQYCYRVLNMRYFLRDNNKSFSGSSTRVFHDFLYKKLDIEWDKQDICKKFGLGTGESFDDLKQENSMTINLGLEHIAYTDEVVCAAVYYDGGNINHVITCYQVEMLSDHSARLYCVDSDDFNVQPKTIELEKSDGIWSFSEGGRRKRIYRIETLISNSTKPRIKLSLDDIKYKSIDDKTSTVYATELAGCSAGDDGITVSGVLFDSIVMNEGHLMIISGAEAEEMIVHGGGSVVFETGSIARGTIRTTGGVLMVESGVNVSEAEFDFAVSRMDEGNNTRLLNNLHNVSGAKLNITIVNGQSAGRYVLAGGASDFAGTLSVVGEYDYMNDVGEGFEDGHIGNLGLENTLSIENKLYSLSVKEDNLILTIEEEKPVFDPPTNLIGTEDKVSWEATGAEQYIVEYSTDGFEHVIQVVTTGNEIGMPDLPAGTYQWRVKADGGEEWSVGEDIVSEAAADDTPKVVQAVEDGKDDLFFASTNGKWSLGYYARHVGSINDWTGTNEVVSAAGKGRIRDLFFGSTDPNVLCLTDGENGDAIFVDDAFTGLPEEIEENTARATTSWT